MLAVVLYGAIQRVQEDRQMCARERPSSPSRKPVHSFELFRQLLKAVELHFEEAERRSKPVSKQNQSSCCTIMVARVEPAAAAYPLNQ